MTAATPAYVTCPKCLGAKTLYAFRHVANGDCFRCDGNGTVEVSSIKAGEVVPAPAPKVKIVDLGAEGTAQISRAGQGYEANLGREAGSVWFEVRGGKVVAPQISDGLRRAGRGPAILAALQAALRA